jgi:MoxR-like ATPase
MLNGRPFVAPNDVRAVALNVLPHRLILTADGEGDAKARERIIEETLSKVGYRRGVRAV